MSDQKGSGVKGTSMNEVQVNVDVKVGVEADFPEYDFLPIHDIKELKVGSILVNIPTCEVHKVTEIREGEVPLVMLDGKSEAPFPVVQRVLSRAVKKDG